MIRYSLRCEQGHEFEGWFRSGNDFDAQAQRGLLACTACGASKVEKAMMAPNVASSDKRAAVPVAAAQPAGQPRLPVGNRLPAEFVEFARKLRTHVRENAEYVGPRFADEARRIYYEESEPRGIYGEATLQEARELRDEGIDAHPLPVLPDDAN